MSLFHQDVIHSKEKKLASSDLSLIELRRHLLDQNSYLLQRQTRKFLLGSSDSSNNSDERKEPKKKNFNSDSSNLEKAP